MITGYCFFRDRRLYAEELKDNEHKAMLKGHKKVLFAGVAFVPEEMKTDDVTYSMNGKFTLDDIVGTFFDGDAQPTVTMILEDPQKAPSKIGGLRIDQILADGSYIPKRKSK